MKIGILTFHWATNYGAILQAYALQEYLKSQGHEVEVINYKPPKYDFSWMNLVRRPSNLFHLKSVLLNRVKEQCLQQWREMHLCLTKRFFSTDELKVIANDYDAFISGSDQILNPSFTVYGENKPTSAYYLTFVGASKYRIGYAVSFGCISYPDNARPYAKDWITSFDKIGVREQTGLAILRQLGYERDNTIVPDPTILQGISLFKELTIFDYSINKDYICVYMLRRKLNVKIRNAIYIDEGHNVYSMEQWLGLIKYAKVLITNSYHGMIMAILFHVPFFVSIEHSRGIGMNDRFYTLLDFLNLSSRIIKEDVSPKIMSDTQIDWNVVDSKIKNLQTIGISFLRLNT